eukprot:TRINITY_DN8840_c0_g1_i2.p1 TRINITY_DN8840_c0_g1~~TRINITY_DN8840_c0_g1_i2.p1  ORF type:complete len:976 (-),score=175.83 TRINITY_DN8840_c0_g1_i2:67-2994(-)
MVRMKTPTWLKGFVKGSSSQGDQPGSNSSSNSLRGSSVTRQSSSLRTSKSSSDFSDQHAVTPSPSAPASTRTREGFVDNSLNPLNLMRGSKSAQKREVWRTEAQTAVDKLVRLCNGTKASPVSRCLGGFCTLMKEILETQDSDVPSVAATALSAAQEFLKAGRSPETWLQFALLVHTDAGVISRLSGDVEGAIVLVCQAAEPSSRRGQESGPSASAAILLDEWQRNLECFKARCKDLWELYVYFVFLDTKGDSALLRMVARQLQAQLETSERGLLANLMHTGLWACSTLRFLAERKGQAFLERRHRQGLTEWHSALAAATEACALEAAEPGRKEELHKQQADRFWNHYFQTSKISWADFADAFQDCFCGGFCPQDLMDRLQSKVKSSNHHMTLHAWQTLLEKQVNGVPGLFLELLREVLQDIPSCIYWQPAGSGTDETDIMHFFSRLRLGDSSIFQEGSGSSGTQQKLGSSPGAAPDSSPVDTSASSKAASQKAPQFEATKDTDKLSTTLGVAMVDPHQGVDQTPQAASRLRNAYPESVTPQDPRLLQGVVMPGAEITWDSFVEKLFSCSRPWWAGPPESSSWYDSQPRAAPGTHQPESLQVQAIRQVKSSLVPTRKALILRVASGQLSAGRPLLQVPREALAAGSGMSLKNLPKPSAHLLPAIVITPNDTKVSCITKFGRGSKEGAKLLPDMMMSEPIASRSHFEIIYNSEKNKYQVMDSGSKWGTFMKVSHEGQPVSCGDWIRIGNAELIVRFCGGGCNCVKRHAHHRLHSINVAHSICGPNFLRSGITQPRQTSYMPWRRQWAFDDATQAHDGDLEDQDATEIPAQIIGIVSGGCRINACQKAWPGSFQQVAMQVDARDAAPKPGEKTRVNSSKDSGTLSPSKGRPKGLALPAGPLELDFISGHRSGERLMVTDRLCTIGRGDRCTIQLSDPQLANVSRTHCVFQCVGNRWWLSDGGSTNGTWNRLRCVLEP